MTDRYLKIILTVIALELFWLGVKDIGTPVAARHFALMLSPVWQPQLRTSASRVKIPRRICPNSFS